MNPVKPNLTAALGQKHTGVEIFTENKTKIIAHANLFSIFFREKNRKPKPNKNSPPKKAAMAPRPVEFNKTGVIINKEVPAKICQNPPQADFLRKLESNKIIAK